MANQTVYPYGTGGSLPSSIGIVNDLTTGGADKALSAEAGKELNSELYGGTVSKTKADASIVRVFAGVESPNGTRIRVILPIKNGESVSASCNLGKGVAASIYSTYNACLNAGNNYLQTISYTYVSSLNGTSNYDGYLCVSLAKSDDTAFSDAEMATYVAALQLTVSRTVVGDINEIKEELNNVESGSGKKEELFLGTLVQKALTSNGLTDTNASKRVSTSSKMVVPFIGAKLEFIIPEGYAVGIRSGNEANNLSNNNFWYYNGDSFSFPLTDKYFRLCFAKGTKPIAEGADQAVTVSEINAYIESGDIMITYSTAEGGIVSRNYETEKYVKGAMRNFVSGASNNGSLTKLPIFAHTSDIHGDAKRFKQFAEYCDYLGVDAALVTGDVTSYQASYDGVQFVNDIADEHDTPVLLCTGNHDTWGLNTDQEQNETIMGYLITKNEAVTNPDVTYPTYYYKDFPAKNIRVISLNIYEGNHSGQNCNFSKDQCDWFISVLASTPANYGVLVLFHSPESMPTAPSGKGAFRQAVLNYTGLQSGLSGTPFAKIIDAFIGKTTLSLSYTSGGSDISTTADFTGVASGVEFIAYVNGHLHTDTVGYIPSTTHIQLDLNVCCGIAIYGSSYPYLANNSDLPRDAKGSTQDCFNIYAIDRSAKTVRIAKVGSNISGYDLSERKYMEIPYAE